MTPNLHESHSSLWRVFLTAYTTITEKIERDLAAADLPPLTWYDVLWTLEQAPDHRLRLHELAEKILLSRSNLTRLLDRLEAAGLLCRERCPNDRRGAYAVLTDAGMTMRQRMWPLYAEGIAKYFTAHLSPKEVTIMHQALERVLKG
jgi:DNA-binding MarR family transcriptional regulator